MGTASWITGPFSQGDDIRNSLSARVGRVIDHPRVTSKRTMWAWFQYDHVTVDE